MRKANRRVQEPRGRHEDTIRELRIGPPDGIDTGPPLTEFHGVLTGVPRYVGGAGGLMRGQVADPQT